MLKTPNISCNYSNNFTYSCVFWDFNMNYGFGDWNSSGCSLTVSNLMYTCSCSHTTNFAVLIVCKNYTLECQ